MADSLNALRLREMENRLADKETPLPEPGEDTTFAIVGAALGSRTAPLYFYLAQALDRIDELERRLAELETKGRSRWR